MTTLSIQFDPDIAQAFQASQPEQQQKIQNLLNQWMRQALKISTLQTTMDKLSNEAEANVNQHVCIIRANKKILFQFLHSVMISEIGQNQIFSKQSGTNREGLNFEQLKNFDIPLPSQKEQIKILDFIKKETSTIETLISKYQKQTDLMQEYRTALISQAVTGKIDVREWKPR